MREVCLIGSRVCLGLALILLILFSIIIIPISVVTLSPSVTGHTLVPGVDIIGSITRKALVTVDIHDQPTYIYRDPQGVPSKITIHHYRMVLDKIILVDSNGTQFVILDREADIDLRGHNTFSTIIPYCHTIVKIIIVLKRIEFNATCIKDFNGNGRWDEPPLMYGFINCNDSRGIRIPEKYQVAYQQWKEAILSHRDWMRQRGWTEAQWNNETECPWLHSFEMPSIPPEGLTIEIPVHFHVGTSKAPIIHWDIGMPLPTGWKLPTNTTVIG